MDPLRPGPEETLDRLVGDWRVFQLARGHRFSTDDVLTAWTAARWGYGSTRLLDLGAGIGSVGLMTLWKMPEEARLVMVEVQEISHRLARRSVRLNGLEDRVELRLGDLRDPSVVPERGRFDLITGSPPYLPLGTAVVSPHPQRAGARVELKGDIFDYCEAAARGLSEGGRFCFCHAAADPRPEHAVREAGLILLERRDVVFRAGREPTISLFAAARAGARVEPPPLIIRDEDGAFTDEIKEIRAWLGRAPARPRAGG